MAKVIITIDGPAASGKSTAAALLAEKLGATFLDTGAMYRAVTLAAMQDKVDMNNQDKLLGVLDKNTIRFDTVENKMKVSINNIDVTEQIRSASVTANAHYIASCVKLRERLVQMQRQFAAGCEKIVTEGRDQGTVVFPNANVKFYLTATLPERARRRQAQMNAESGCRTIEQIQEDIEERDQRDKTRATGPLLQSDDAVVVDTTALTIEQVVEKLSRCVKEKIVIG